MNMTGSTWPLFIHALANYCVFVVAAIRFFRTGLKPSKLIYVLKTTAVVSLILQLTELRRTIPSVPGAVLGELLLSLSSLIFLWALHVNRPNPLSEAYSTDLPKFVQTRGPYKFVRHPFYLSYICSYLAGVVVTGSSVLAIQTAVMLAIYSGAASFEERKFGKSRFSGEYAKYRKTTGMFFPKIFRILEKLLSQR